MSDRGDRLVAALKANPDLLYEVLVRLGDVKVAGPWETALDNQYKRIRRSETGKLIAVVTKHATRRLNPWEASVRNPVDSEDVRPQENHMQQGLALDWCDMRLLEQGYQIAGGRDGGH